MAAWTGWEQSVLFDLGAPDSVANVRFLHDWHPFEQSKCRNNPLNTTLRTKTSTNCVQVSGSTWVQSYPTELAGAKATADTLRGTYYVAIVNALRGGDPYTYGVPQAVANGIRTWGTPLYADAYLKAVGATPKPTPPPGTTLPGAGAASPTHQVGAAWTRLMHTMAHYVPAQVTRTRKAQSRLRKAVR
jgi:hypothetical protein